jgi:hypothetical protein
MHFKDVSKSVDFTVFTRSRNSVFCVMYTERFFSVFVMLTPCKTQVVS